MAVDQRRKKSCTLPAVSEHEFLDMLRRSAARTGKVLTILRIAGAGADHPIGLHVPETRYLKAVFARVERA